MDYWWLRVLVTGSGRKDHCGEICKGKSLPFFGICLGMQMAVIEFARNVLGLKEAHSTEMDPDTHESGD